VSQVLNPSINGSPFSIGMGNFGKGVMPSSQTSGNEIDLENLDDDNEINKCKLCDEMFETGQALGGHMSRAHPGQSTDYNRKKTVRERRTFLREIHKKAKQIYESHYGGKINRSTLRKIKESLMREYVQMAQQSQTSNS
jgi:hypothetical protein